MESKRSRASVFLWLSIAVLVSQNLVLPVLAISLDDQKTYYPPDPHSRTPSSPSSGGSHGSSSHGSGSGSHGSGSGSGSHGSSSHGSPHHHHHHSSPSCGTPPSHGGSPSTPSSPSGGGGGYYPPPTPDSPVPTTPTPDVPITISPPSTPSSPSGGGGGYYAPPTPDSPVPTTPTPDVPISISPPSTPTPVIPIDPGTPDIPIISSPPSPFLPDPNSPPSFPGTCDYWRSHPEAILALFGWWGTLGSIMGLGSTPSIFGTHMTLPEALSNTRTDGIGALYREGTASLLNSMVNTRFPYSTEQVRDRFLASLVSNKAASAQAELFKRANEGQL